MLCSYSITKFVAQTPHQVDYHICFFLFYFIFTFSLTWDTGVDGLGILFIKVLSPCFRFPNTVEGPF